MPELELGQPANKRTELLILFRRERGFTIFETFILSEGGVEFWLEEGQEEVEEVDAETVGNYVPALGEDDAQEEEDEDCDGADPAVGYVGS